MSDRAVEWPRVTLADILAEANERAGDLGGIPVLSVTKTRGLMLASERFGKPLHARNLSRYRVARRGSVVADPMLLWDGSIGVQDVVDVGLVSPDYRVYQSTAATTSAYLQHLVRSPAMVARYGAGARGTNVRRNRIARSDFGRISVRLPPLPEQRKIAAILSSVDDAIAKTEAVIEQVRMVQKGLMRHLLTRGMPGRHAKLKQTEIGRAPDGWDVVTIGSLLESCTYGVNCPLTTDSSLVPVLRMGNISDDQLDLDDLKYADLRDADPDKVLLRVGDILFNRTNSYDLVGKVALVNTDRRLSYASYLLRLRTDPRRCAPGWLHARLAAEDMKRTLKTIATKGVSQSNINPSKMRSLLVAVPPLDEQDEIVAALEGIAARVRAERAVMDSLSGIKSALTTRLLSGSIRVPTQADDAA